jgi:hypothetical protein
MNGNLENNFVFLSFYIILLLLRVQLISIRRYYQYKISIQNLCSLGWKGLYLTSLAYHLFIKEFGFSLFIYVRVNQMKMFGAFVCEKFVYFFLYLYILEFIYFSGFVYIYIHNK